MVILWADNTNGEQQKRNFVGLWYHLGLKFAWPRHYWSTWNLPELRLSGQSSTPCPASPSGACVGVIAAEIWLTQPCKNQTSKTNLSYYPCSPCNALPFMKSSQLGKIRQDSVHLVHVGHNPVWLASEKRKFPFGFHFSWKIEFSPLVRALAKMLEDHHTTQIHHALMIKRNSEVRATIVHT